MQGMPRLLSHDMWRRRERIIRSRRLFLSAVSRPLVSSLPERLGKDGSRKGKPPFLRRARGLLRESFFYDVGGTMGSPYIFQVSGR